MTKTSSEPPSFPARLIMGIILYVIAATCLFTSLTVPMNWCPGHIHAAAVLALALAAGRTLSKHTTRIHMRCDIVILAASALIAVILVPLLSIQSSEHSLLPIGHLVGIGLVWVCMGNVPNLLIRELILLVIRAGWVASFLLVGLGCLTLCLLIGPIQPAGLLPGDSPTTGMPLDKCPAIAAAIMIPAILTLTSLRLDYLKKKSSPSSPVVELRNARRR